MSDINEFTIRDETPGDREAVRRINESAFDSEEEANLLEALHREGAVLASLVAEHQGQLVGHILFSRMWGDTDQGEELVIVVGHPTYYPRFGFSTEATRLLQGPFAPEAFMALALIGNRLPALSGKVRYSPPFGI